MLAKARFIGGTVLLAAIAATLGGCVIDPGYGPRRDDNAPVRRYEAPRQDHDWHDNHEERREDHDDRDRRG